MPHLVNPETIQLTPETRLELVDLKKAFGRSDLPDLEIDLGCGKGRFLLARADTHKDTCFLGIDRRRPRIERISRAVQRGGMVNIRLLCSEIYFAVESFIPAESVLVYYLFFPDPWPKRRHHRRRLFDADFLNAIHRTLRGRGKIHIATDHFDYFSIIKNLLAADRRFVETDHFVPGDNERTNFELVFMGQMKPIGRCSFMKKSP